MFGRKIKGVVVFVIYIDGRGNIMMEFEFIVIRVWSIWIGINIGVGNDFVCIYCICIVGINKIECGVSDNIVIGG